MAEPNNIPSSLSPTTEITPLLTTAAGESSTQQQSTEETAQPLSSDAGNVETSVSNPRFVRSIKVLTFISLISSSACLVLLLASLITSALAPLNGYYTSELQGTTISLGIAIIVSTILSYLNLRIISQPIPAEPQRTTFFSPLFTLFLDLLLALFIWNLSGLLFDKTTRISQDCYSSDCGQWTLALTILCDISVGIAVAVGLAHFILLILRYITTFHAGLVSGQFPWTFSTGIFTVELTVKLLRQERVNGN